jgi:MFS family permease
LTSAVTAPAVPAPKQFGALRHAALAVFWLGTYYVVTPVYTILLQVQVARAVAPSVQGAAVGAATGIGGLLALVIPPLVGFWSDRLNTRWGRRAPVIVGGVAGTVVALAVMRFAGGYPTVLLGFCLVVAFINFSSAAYVGVIPDTVHSRETGRASGFLGLCVQAGSVLSLITLLLLSRSGHLLDTYWLLMAVLVLTMVVSLWAMGGTEQKRPVAAIDLKTFFAPLWKGDFAWAVFTRFLNTSAFYTPLPFLLFAFRDLQHVAKPADFTAEFELLVTAVAVPVAILCGWLSDGRGRKPFVYASSAVAAGVLLTFLLGGVLSPSLVLVFGVVYGLGYGAWVAVDWALALDTLPDRDNPAKDLGLFHIADALPRVLIPLLAGVLLDAFNAVQPELGYRVLFVTAALLYILGGVFVSRIRSVR